MSIISSKSNKDRQGFTPYQSDQELNDKQLSLLSKLNINDQIQASQSPNLSMLSFDKYSCDLRSITSKKRKLSEEFININTSRIGRNTYLGRSIIGKSSLDGSFLHELEEGYSQLEHQNSIKKEIQQNSCPVVIKNQERQDFFFGGQAENEKPRFTKTKNLLRNLCTYLHKFLLYNKRGQKWLRDHFQKQVKRRNRRKQSQSVSQSNKSSDLSGFQDMCRIEDTIKIEQTPKIEANYMNFPPPLREDSDNFLNSNKQSLSFEEKYQMRDEKFENYNPDNQFQHQIESEIRQFRQWIDKISLVNFSDYESIWTKNHKYRGLYRICCYKYYRDEAICDIYRSRLGTKQISASYLHQFIEGVLQPREFYRFK